MKQDAGHNSDKNGFGVPGSYFGDSARAIRHRIECLDELQDLVYLTALRNKNPFVVPEGYFEEKAAKIKTSLPAYRSGKPGPGGDGENQRSAEGKLHHRRGSAKVLPLFVKRWRVAVAAALIVAAGLWFYRFMAPQQKDDCNTIACLDRIELLGSPAVEHLSDEDLIQLIDAESLEKELFELPQGQEKPGETDQKDV